MNDQERITDMILTEKKMSTNYNTFASECVDDQLRDEYLKILNQSHMTQTALFKAAQSKGWYKVPRIFAFEDRAAHSGKGGRKTVARRPRSVVYYKKRGRASWRAFTV